MHTAPDHPANNNQPRNGSWRAGLTLIVVGLMAFAGYVVVRLLQAP
jgi:hypothetical protein